MSVQTPQQNSTGDGLMNINDMEYGYCFHVYLRKYSDTKSSILLWNMINVIIDRDDDVAKKDRVWPSFCAWCDKYWKENPDTPFYDVALRWCKTNPRQDENGAPANGTSYMFQAALEMACEETREDLNATAEYDLGYV